MENETCMEYLFHSIEKKQEKNINQEILLNASNEFRNIWNLVKKLRDLARVDVKKITCFLDAVQEGLQKGTWSAASRNCLQADNEYRHIRRYIRPSFLEDFKVSQYIEKAEHCGKSATKREKKLVPASVNGSRKQSFRNKQINKQDPLSNLGGKNTDTKKQKEKPNENKNGHKESTNTKSKSSDGKKVDDKKDKSNNNLIDSTSKTSIQVGLESHSNKSSNVTKTECVKNLENKENKENSQSRENDNGISNNQDSDINAREEGDGSERKQESKEIKSENGSVTTHADTLTGTGQEDIVIENETKKLHFHQDDSLKTDCKTKTKETEQKQDVNLEGDAIDAVAKENNEASLSISAKQDSTSSSNEPLSSAEENATQLNKKSCSDSVHRAISVPIDSSKMVSEQMTRINFECVQEEIISELDHVYETDWKCAYNALTGCQPSNGIKNTTDFLGEILKLSAGDVRKALETTLSLGNGKVSVLESLKKLKLEFLSRHLKELQKEHSIEYHDGEADEYAVNLYSAKCVELSWFMLTRNPPMVFDYDSRPMLLEDLLEIFRPYKNEGHCIHYIVWPAIRRSKYDVVVAQGIAEFR